ncbi:MAG: hypothetical protein AAFQ43_09435 [Bacteroidota bacterium]
MTATTSLLLGAALGVAHAVAGLGIARLARGRSQAAFNAVVLGGTVLRMFGVLAVVVLLLLVASIQVAPFIGGLGATFLVGLIVEVLVLLRRPMPAALTPEASGAAPRV